MESMDIREMKRSVSQECNVEVGLKEYKIFSASVMDTLKKLYVKIEENLKERDCARMTLETFRQEIKPALV
jgi:hypothetical protein